MIYIYEIYNFNDFYLFSFGWHRLEYWVHLVHIGTDPVKPHAESHHDCNHKGQLLIGFSLLSILVCITDFDMRDYIPCDPKDYEDNRTN